VRENEKSRMLPVIILTAKYITKQELAFLKHNGIHQLIRKGDINKEQLLETIIRMMTPLTEHPTETGKAILPVPVHGTPLILVVEDNPDNLLTMKALIPGNIKILEAGDGITGVELAKSSLPDLILMDIALPGMNGIQALMELRKERTTRMIPVIAVSASAMKGDREHFLKFGFNDYISKPIDSGLFPEIIEKWVGRSA
jgi:CheY-like chemotaxis protein